MRSHLRFGAIWYRSRWALVLGIAILTSACWIQDHHERTDPGHLPIAFDRGRHDREAVRLSDRGADATASAPRGDKWSSRSATFDVSGRRKAPFNDVALMLAVRANRTANVSALLRHGANANVRDKTGESALIAACRLPTRSDEFPGAPRLTCIDYCSIHQIIDVLIAYGANVDAQDAYKRTPLWYSAFSGDAISAECLMRQGAAVNSVDVNGYTPLHAAFAPHRIGKTSMFGVVIPSESLIRALLHGGAAVNSKDNSGSTAMMDAAEIGVVSTVKLLMAAGADSTLTNSHGESPRSLAVLMGHSDVVGLLDGRTFDSRSRSSDTLAR